MDTTLFNENIEDPPVPVQAHTDDVVDKVSRHVEMITESWRQSVSSVIETGRRLLEAKQDPMVSHGAFTKLIEEHLPFGTRTAQCLMAIASDPRLSKAQHAALLPSHWATLYEISRLPNDTFDQALTDGTISAVVDRATVKRLQKGSPAISQPENSSVDTRPPQGAEESSGEDQDQTPDAPVAALPTQRFDELRKRVKNFRRDLLALAAEPYASCLGAAAIKQHCGMLVKHINFARPYAKCHSCDGTGCDVCANQGWLTKAKYEDQREDRELDVGDSSPTEAGN